MKKFCVKCNTEHNTGEFTKDKTTKDGFYHICKICKRSESNKRYQSNEQQREKIRVRSKKRRELHRGIVSTIKTTLGCISCGENSHPNVLEFHHVSDDKEITISRRSEVSLLKILTEIQKCVCLCANCHRKLHVDLIQIDTNATVSQEVIDTALKTHGINDISDISYRDDNIKSSKIWMYNSDKDHQTLVDVAKSAEFLKKGYVLGIKPRV